MTEPCTPETQERNRGNTEEISETDLNGLDGSDRKAIMEWIRYEDEEEKYKPYISHVIQKTLNSEYESSRQVYDELKLLKPIRTKLTEGKDKLLVETYATEYFYHCALKKKAEIVKDRARERRA
ncbi:hypothetical protein C5167_027120 [Papaver somniferum]|uniref:uncharacterized protein LOC113336025 n=1 Tax=Papaver somniferum TaxID=3469 RepID=UPI000E700C30|nr:uncharacterized protein LOC113336025 [Papaver somniferum]RZC89579.1 hypothetical protein C5167_027120 [Papaver somniferum]